MGKLESVRQFSVGLLGTFALKQLLLKEMSLFYPVYMFDCSSAYVFSC